MAETFKSNQIAITTSNQDIVPAIAASTTAIVLSIRATNVDGTNDATVDVQVVDTGGSPTAYIAKTMSVPADTSLELAGQSKLVLETGDKIQGLASADNDVEIFVSYLEIT
jgi:hypothetical protein|tara:strand:- start:3540 stop:3872 length:333 start_codon:yes stop_codon:yes gene_type:complete